MALQWLNHPVSWLPQWCDEYPIAVIAVFQHGRHLFAGHEYGCNSRNHAKYHTLSNEYVYHTVSNEYVYLYKIMYIGTVNTLDKHIYTYTCKYTSISNDSNVKHLNTRIQYPISIFHISIYLSTYLHIYISLSIYIPSLYTLYLHVNIFTHTLITYYSKLQLTFISHHYLSI